MLAADNKALIRNALEETLNGKNLALCQRVLRTRLRLWHGADGN